MEEQQLCACGCGNPIIPKRNHRWEPVRFITGHHTRGRAHHVYTPLPEEIPSGICECGCGKPTGIAAYTQRKKRYFRGHPVPFCVSHSLPRLGPNAPRWKGGRFVDKKGHIFILMPGHHLAGRFGHVAEHRVVMEEKLGRPLVKGEIVHHINHIPDDNRPENLMLTNKKEHGRLHLTDPVTQESARAAHKTPEYHQKAVVSHANYSDATREKMSQSAAKRWQNPAEREKLLEARKKLASNPAPSP